MPSNESPAKAIAAANLPKFVETTTLVEEKQQGLRDIVKNREYRTDSGLTSYILRPAGRSLVPSRQAAKMAAIFGKELLLSKQPVYFTPLAGFLREVRLLSYSPESEAVSPVLSHLGKGYLVVADFDDTSAQPSTAVWHDALDMLQSHVSRGGGLVLAVNPSWDAAEGTTSSFANVAETFQVLSV